MILIDANILIYAYDEASRQHRSARGWLAGALAGPAAVCFSWIAIMAFVRVTTNRKLFVKPYSTDEAFSVVENWLSAPASKLVSPGPEHLRIVKQIAHESGVLGADLTDAHLAAIAVEYNLQLATTDRDFLSFDGLRIVNPLAEV